MSYASGFYELLSEISSALAGVVPENTDGDITTALQRIIDFFSADCCVIFRAVKDQDAVESIYAVDRATAMPPYLSMRAKETLPHLFNDMIMHKGGIFLRVSSDFSTASELQQARLIRSGIKAVMAAPVITGGSFDYLCCLASAKLGHSWTKSEVAEYQLLAEILASTISRKDLQAALDRANRDLSEVQRMYRFGSWEWDVDSDKIVAMEAVDRILGVKPETQSAFMDRVYSADRIPVQKAIADALSRRAERPMIEYRVHTRRADVRIARSRFEVLRSENSTHMIGTFHDITNVRRGEEELQRLRSQHWHADRIARTGVLVSSLAHELSQPLAAIMANAQAALRFLAQKPVDPEGIREILADIVADNRRAGYIIDALRAMIRGRETKREDTDLTDVAREVLALLHSELVAQQVEVELVGDGRPYLVHADKTQLEQVLLNLALNAIESMQGQVNRERRLRVVLSRVRGNEIQLSVQDTGIGIPREQLGKVFEAFWTTKVHGLGMGLGVCRSIVEAHGGRMWAESDQGHGATFVVRLPAAAEALLLQKSNSEISQ